MSRARRTTVVRLTQAHEVLARERPSEQARPEKWLAYYRRSAAVYRHVAETDRGHHHEALYWAAREDSKAREIEDRLGGSSGGGRGDA